ADLAQDRKLLLVRPAPPALHPCHHLIAHAVPAAYIADVKNDANNDGHYTSARAPRKAVQPGRLQRDAIPWRSRLSESPNVLSASTGLSAGAWMTMTSSVSVSSDVASCRLCSHRRCNPKQLPSGRRGVVRWARRSRRTLDTPL